MGAHPKVSRSPLVMKVRRALRATEPRPDPTERKIGPYGYWKVKCPDCGQWCHAKRGSYEHHWTVTHGTPFWKEKYLIKIIKKGLLK